MRQGGDFGELRGAASADGHNGPVKEKPQAAAERIGAGGGPAA
ncbi:MAG: hypothetical protein WBQ64_04705 [Terriglobales bacterium]